MAKHKILIVEDEGIFASDLQNMLNNLGFKNSFVAHSGEKALYKVEKIQPDLVLVDIVLKGEINGIDVAHEIKNRFNIPVIYITAYSDENTLQKAKITEPYGYLLKPFGEKELNIAIEIALYKFKMEKKLIESETKLKTIFEFAPDGIYLNDLKGNFIDGNKSVEKIIGYKRKELIGKNFIELKILPSEYKQKSQENLMHNAKGEPTGPDEFILIRKDGSKVPVEITTHPVEINNNIIVIGIARDITERKQAEDELRKEKRFTENIIATVPDSLLVIDKNLKIKSANRTFYETFQMEPKKVIGASITNILGDEDGRLSTELTRLFGTEDMLENFELHYQSKKMGSSREAQRLTSKGERIFNITARGIIIAEEEEEEEEEELVVLRDITERKNSEEELKNAYTKLEDTQKELIQSETLAALGGFASGVAHEIRNPLANISASAQYCINKFDLARKIKNYLRIIIRNSNKANRIIKDLLDFARPRELVFKKGNIVQPLNKACDLTKAKRLNYNIRLYKRCSRVLPKILMDEKRMEQVFLNIIINSIDSMSKGGRLSITAYPEYEYVVINISDTGKGISEQDISKIFNPFFTKKSDGVGLGLSVTHKLIQSHKGKIEVESKYNKGTKFTIKLPIYQEEKKSN